MASLEERLGRVVGDNGEQRAGRERGAEAEFNAGRGKAAEGMASERGFAQQLSAEQQAKQIEGWQEQVAKNNKDIEGYNVSLKTIDDSIAAGKLSVEKNPKMAKLNETLAVEAVKEQQVLLAAKEVLIRANQDLEGKIVSAVN